MKDICGSGFPTYPIFSTLFLAMGKAICFHKIDPIIKPKNNRPQDFYDISMCMCNRQDGQNWYI